MRPPQIQSRIPLLLSKDTTPVEASKIGLLVQEVYFVGHPTAQVRQGYETYTCSLGILFLGRN